MPDDGYERVVREYPLMRISLQYCEPVLKARLTAMYGLLLSLEDCITRASEPEISRAKLGWWYEELQQARTATGNHPVTIGLQTSGALSCWSPSLVDSWLQQTLSRVDAPGLNDDDSLRKLCEAIGMVHLELEASLYAGSPTGLTETLPGAVASGFMQILRESYLAKLASFYWVPLTFIAQSGISRSQIASNRTGLESRRMLVDLLKRLDISSTPEPLTSRTSQGVTATLASKGRHWLVLTTLQQRQLQRLKRKLEASEFSGEISVELHAAGMWDGWVAWRTARRLNPAKTELEA